MSVRQRRALAVERRQQAWSLYIAGKTQQEIATVLGVTRQAVAKTIAKAEQDAVARMDEAVRTAKIKDLDRLEHITREALRAWDKSKRTRVKTVEKTADEGGSVTITKERLAGEARYLSVAVEAMEREAKLLGLDAPARTVNTNMSVDRPLEGLSDEELKRELVEINRQLGIKVGEVDPRIH
jgi:predicted transcriptional regulator